MGFIEGGKGEIVKIIHRHCFSRHGIAVVDEISQHDQYSAKGRQDIQGRVRLLLRHASKISFCLFLFSIYHLERLSLECELSLSSISLFKDSPTGLYVSLTSFLGLNQEHVMWYYNKTSYPVYLHIKRTRKEVILIYSINCVQDFVSLSGTSFMFKVSDEYLDKTRYISIVI